MPIVESLETPEPLLDRSSLNSIFSNFIDIWNFHRSFLSALDSYEDGPLHLSSLLLSHFPYLSLYTPFITAFPSIITSLSEICAPTSSSHNAAFAAFLTRRESDPRCGKLKLRDWLLTIVQRCPRYLLLLKDLISTTDTQDPEHAQLLIVHGLVSKSEFCSLIELSVPQPASVTVGLNKSLHSHAETLALLALQRATTGLPLQLISPGRRLVKRGPLLQAERNTLPRPREFLLFSDCLIWLASADASWESLGGWSSAGDSSSSSVRPGLTRNRSRSEAELPRANLRHGPSQRQSYHPSSPMPPPLAKRRDGSSSQEKWVYKGRVDLVDLDVTVGSKLGGDPEYRFEILNPEESFVVYAGRYLSEPSRTHAQYTPSRL